VRCTPDDYYNSIIYEHSVVAQAVAAGPQAVAPPWFQGQVQDAIQQLRVDIRNEMRAEIFPYLKRVCPYLQKIYIVLITDFKSYSK